MSQTEQSLLQGIDTVIMRVSDFVRSRDWYEHILGLQCIWVDEQMQLAVFNSNGPTSLTIWRTSTPVQVHLAATSYPIIKTPDARALRELFLSKGIKTEELIQDDHVIYFLFFDPDGNVMEACQSAQ